MHQRVICVMGRVLDQDDGLGVYSANLLRHMAALDTKSRYVIILRTRQNESLFREFPNVETQVIECHSKVWWDQVVTPRVARRARADIVFNPKFSVPLLSRRPCVFVLQGSDWYVNPGNYQWWDNIYIRVVLPLYCRKAARLLAISQLTVDDLAKHARVDTRKVTVTYAAPAAHFSPALDRAKLSDFARRYRLPERFILHVGRVYDWGSDPLIEYPGSNTESLVVGYERYRSAGGDLALVVAGKDIEKYLRARGFGDDALEGIHFTGFIPNEEIVKAYNLAEFLVITTLYESFCLPLVEALASGCPAIAPSTGACPEIAGEAARYVDPRDPTALARVMTELAKSANQRAELRAAGMERAQAFSWDRTAERTLAVFESIAPTGAFSPQSSNGVLSEAVSFVGQ